MEKLNLSDIIWGTLPTKKIGYVAIIWRPNTGKSTFVNSLIWEKISITTNVPQTTRNKILAIYNDEESQIIFFDTPWIHESQKVFNEQINNAAVASLGDADLVLYFIDTSREWWEEERYIKTILANVKKTIIKVYTKSDLPPKIQVPTNENTFSISSLSKTGFTELLTKIKTFLKTGTIHYPEEYYTFQTPFFRVAEIVREKIFLHTKEELPHSIYVAIEEIQDEKTLLKIMAYVYAETESQKYILIGKGGGLLTTIWKEAREELEKIYGKKVFLSLRVKVNPKWRKNVELSKKILEVQ